MYASNFERLDRMANLIGAKVVLEDKWEVRNLPGPYYGLKFARCNDLDEVERVIKSFNPRFYYYEVVINGTLRMRTWDHDEAIRWIHEWQNHFLPGCDARAYRTEDKGDEPYKYKPSEDPLEYHESFR